MVCHPENGQILTCFPIAELCQAMADDLTRARQLKARNPQQRIDYSL